MISHLTAEDVAALGLSNLEYRYFDDTPHPDLLSPNYDDNDSICDMYSVNVYADGLTEEAPHCDDSVAEAGDGILEGIGGTYAKGGTFSYIEDNQPLMDAYNHLHRRRYPEQSE